MDADHAVLPERDFRGGVVAPGGEIADVGVDCEPRRGEDGLVFQIPRDAAHERRIHDLHGKHDLILLRDGARAAQSLFKKPQALRRGRLIVNVISGELDNTDAELPREQHGLFRDLVRTRADRGVGAAVGEAPVTAQTHRLDGYARFAYGAVQLAALLFCPVEPGEALVRFVNGDFQIVKAKLLYRAQPFLPAKLRREGFLIQSKQMISEHMFYSFPVSAARGAAVLLRT